MVKKIFFILVILGGYLFYYPKIALAQDGGVNMRARVLERKMTDTINDFVWDGQAPSVSSASSTPPKAVLGASTVRPNDISGSAKPVTSVRKSPKKPNKYLLFLPPVYAVYYLIINS